MRTAPATRTPAVVLLCAAALLLTGQPATTSAQEPPGAEPADKHPLLDQLNRETQSLYHQAVGGLVRVELPTPKWADPAAQREELLKRWPNLSADVKRELGGRQVPNTPPSETQPSPTQPAEPDDAGRDTIVVVPPAADPRSARTRQQHAPGAPLEMGSAGGRFAPNNIGMLLDEDGHLLVPLYMDARTAEEAGPIRIAGRDGVVREASFVGSDRQTNLTVLRLHAPAEGQAELAGSAVRLGRDRPAEGSLVLYVAPQDGSGRLGMWTGAATDFGIVFTTDGQAAGIARYGRFLNGPACKLIADQIIRFGKVKRATLGVVISEIRQDAALRRSTPALGNRAAMLISQVIPGSPAEQAGLQAGDLLLSLSGEPVGDIPSLAATIASCSGKTRVQLLREGKTIEAVVELKQE